MSLLSISSHIPLAVPEPRICDKGGGPSPRNPEIPYEALRIALMNAIIHRDYFEEGARVMVEVSDDRVEISNPDELLFDKDDLERGPN